MLLIWSNHWPLTRRRGSRGKPSECMVAIVCCQPEWVARSESRRFYHQNTRNLCLRASENPGREIWRCLPGSRCPFSGCCGCLWPIAAFGPSSRSGGRCLVCAVLCQHGSPSARAGGGVGRRPAHQGRRAPTGSPLWFRAAGADLRIPSGSDRWIRCCDCRRRRVYE